MGSVSTAEMRALEAAAFSQGWSEEKLMNLAGERLGRALASYFPKPGTLIAYLGKGHNAGDALLAARGLENLGWKIFLREAYLPENLAPLTRKIRAEFDDAASLPEMRDFCDFPKPLVLLDGLLGIGSKGALRPSLDELSREIEFLKNHANAFVAAVDLPSGVDPDSGETFFESVEADVTFMIGAPKNGLLRANAVAATGALVLVDVAPLRSLTSSELQLICPQQLDVAKSRRPFDFHKGQAGRVSILAGSKDYTGAAIMASLGALKGGAGLISLFVPEEIHSLISHKAPSEIIVRSYQNPLEVLDHRHDTMVIGCGIGTISEDQESQWTELIRRSTQPTVLDADLLNFLATSKQQHLLAAHHLITPHPGEFARLVPEFSNQPREIAAREFSKRYPATLLFKGSRSLITAPESPLFVNSTGTPAMATGGQGDLLAGLSGALLASGLSTLQAACLGAWLCGRAAERALLEDSVSEESLTPTEVSHHLGGAFKDWKNANR